MVYIPIILPYHGNGVVKLTCMERLKESLHDFHGNMMVTDASWGLSNHDD